MDGWHGQEKPACPLCQQRFVTGSKCFVDSGTGCLVHWPCFRDYVQTQIDHNEPIWAPPTFQDTKATLSSGDLPHLLDIHFGANHGKAPSPSPRPSPRMTIPVIGSLCPRRTRIRTYFYNKGQEILPREDGCVYYRPGYLPGSHPKEKSNTQKEAAYRARQEKAYEDDEEWKFD